MSLHSISFNPDLSPGFGILGQAGKAGWSLARVQKYQVDYWIDFFRANINDSYVARRRVVGDAHTRIGLPLHSYLAAMNLSLKLVTETLYDRSLVEGDYTTKARAVTKLVHLDTSPRSSMYWVMVKRLMSWRVKIERFLKDHWHDPLVEVMNNLHEHIKGTRGAAIGLSSLNLQSETLTYVGIGNTVIRKFGSREIRLVSRAGIICGNMWITREEHMTLVLGDVALPYTDGVKDLLQLYEYPQLLHHNAETISRTILQRLGKHHDDATCIALRYEK